MRSNVTTVAVVAVVAFAAFLRLWHLATPEVLVFDELYYVRDAYSQTVFGYATDWPNNDPAFGSEVAATLLSDPAYVAHPPLGKWMIALGMMLFGVGDGWGWRAATAFVGIATVALTMRLAWRITGSKWIMIVAGLLLSVEGLHVTLSHVSLLDGHLTLLIVIGALLLWRDHEWVKSHWATARDTGRRLWLWRPWLFASAAAFGLAAGVKWSAIAIFAVLLVFVIAQDLIVRTRLRTAVAGLGTLVQTIVLAVPVFLIMLVTYVLTWAGWIFTHGGWQRGTSPWWSVGWLTELWNTHVSLFTWHLGLDDPHPFASHPLGWPISLRPTGMYFEDLGGGWVSAISPLPNVLVTWGGVLALGFLVVVIGRVLVRRRAALVANPLFAAISFTVIGYLAGWLPWVLTVSRSAVYQFYHVVTSPFLVIALAITLALIAGRVTLPTVTFAPHSQRDRLIAVRVFLIASVLLGLAFWPMWSGAPQPDWFRDAHLWLPGWR